MLCTSGGLVINRRKDRSTTGGLGAAECVNTDVGTPFKWAKGMEGDSPLMAPISSVIYTTKTAECEGESRCLWFQRGEEVWENTRASGLWNVAGLTATQRTELRWGMWP